jgi:DNA-binding CsgD family transcriptional regulator
VNLRHDPGLIDRHPQIAFPERRTSDQALCERMMSDDLELLVDRIYEAAVVADEWPPVLHDLAGLVDAGGAALITATGDQYGGWRLSPGLGQAADTYLRSDAPQRSLSLPRLLAANWAGFLTDQDIFNSDDEYSADPLISEWASPSGFFRGVGTAIHVPNGDVAIVQLHRRTGQPVFSAEDVGRLNALRPHLARASVLTTRWREERLRSATQALELLGLPAAVLDPGGRVLAANGLIEAMTGHIVWGAWGRMALADLAADAILAKAVARTGAQMTDATGTGSFVSGNRDGSDPVVFHAIPVEGQARDLFGSALTLVAVTRPGAARTPDPMLIQGLFDLTAAEARVAAGLIDGRSIGEMAGQNGVGVETVRTQVKSILGKTGVQRQAEFIAKFRSVDLPRSDA